MFPIHLGNPASEDQVDMASASQSRFRVAAWAARTTQGRPVDQGGHWCSHLEYGGRDTFFFWGGAGLYKFTHTIVSDSFLFLGGG